MIDQFDHRAKAWRSGRGRSRVSGFRCASVRRRRSCRNGGCHLEKVPKKLGDRITHFRIGFGDVTFSE